MIFKGTFPPKILYDYLNPQLSQEKVSEVCYCSKNHKFSRDLAAELVLSILALQCMGHNKNLGERKLASFIMVTCLTYPKKNCGQERNLAWGFQSTT